MTHRKAGCECENVRRSHSSVVGISSEMLRVLLGVHLPPRALVVHQVLQAVLAFVFFFTGGGLARALVPRAPVLVQVLENGQVSIIGCGRARVLVPRAPVLVQVLESGQVPIKGCGRARVCTPSKVVLSCPLQQPYTPPHSSVVAYVFRSFTKKSKDSLVCLLYTSPSPRDKRQSRMPSSA